MNLSKVHSSKESFEPEMLVARRLDEEAVFGSIIVERLPAQKDATSRDDDAHKPNNQPGQHEVQDLADFSDFPVPDAPELYGQDGFINGSAARQPLQQQESDPGTSPEFPENEVAPAPTQRSVEPEPEMAPVEPPPEPQPEPPPETPQAQAHVQAGIPVEEVQQMLTESYEKGVQEGLQQAEQDFGAASRSLLNISQQLDTIRETILRNSIPEIHNLVLVIAGKIIRKSVEEQSETVLLTVEDAIQKAVKSDELYVFVNPEDFEIIESKSAELMQGLSGLNNLVIRKDPAIERGGCKVESDNCTVDATVLSQLEIISEQLQQQK